MNIPYVALKGILGVCKFIGYKTCAKVAGLAVGKKAITLGANYVLGGFLPFRIVKYIVAAAPYAPAAVVLASGGTAALATNATYIVISQVSDYLFVCAVKKTVWEGSKATGRVAKYVFITKPFGIGGHTSLLDAAVGDLLRKSSGTKNETVDEGWILVEEEGEGDEGDGKAKREADSTSRGAIQQLLQSLNSNKSTSSPYQIVDITEEDVNTSLMHVTKIAVEMEQQEGEEGIELVDVEGVVFEEAWDQSVEVDGSATRKESGEQTEDGFVVV